MRPRFLSTCPTSSPVRLAPDARALTHAFTAPPRETVAGSRVPNREPGVIKGVLGATQLGLVKGRTSKPEGLHLVFNKTTTLRLNLVGLATKPKDLMRSAFTLLMS